MNCKYCKRAIADRKLSLCYGQLTLNKVVHTKSSRHALCRHAYIVGQKGLGTVQVAVRRQMLFTEVEAPNSQTSYGGATWHTLWKSTCSIERLILR